MFFFVNSKLFIQEHVKIYCQIIKKEDKTEIYESTQYH